MDLCIKTIISYTRSNRPVCFNPCFNGSMYKNIKNQLLCLLSFLCFNPCFNGSMYKNPPLSHLVLQCLYVSILVLMDLCIKTRLSGAESLKLLFVSILVLMDLCIKTGFIVLFLFKWVSFQSLF